MAVKDNKLDDEHLEWNVDTEVLLFHAMRGHKPVGVNRYFQMACIHEKFSNSLNKDINSKKIWERLETMYDMAALNESEIIPFPNGEHEFSLPSRDFGPLLAEKRGSHDDFDQSASGPATPPVKMDPVRTIKNDSTPNEVRSKTGKESFSSKGKHLDNNNSYNSSVSKTIKNETPNNKVSSKNDSSNNSTPVVKSNNNNNSNAKEGTVKIPSLKEKTELMTASITSSSTNSGGGKIGSGSSSLTGKNSSKNEIVIGKPKDASSSKSSHAKSSSSTALSISSSSESNKSHSNSSAAGSREGASKKMEDSNKSGAGNKDNKNSGKSNSDAKSKETVNKKEKNAKKDDSSSDDMPLSVTKARRLEEQTLVKRKRSSRHLDNNKGKNTSTPTGSTKRRRN